MGSQNCFERKNDILVSGEYLKINMFAIGDFKKVDLYWEMKERV